MKLLPIFLLALFGCKASTFDPEILVPVTFEIFSDEMVSMAIYGDEETFFFTHRPNGDTTRIERMYKVGETLIYSDVGKSHDFYIWFSVYQDGKTPEVEECENCSGVAIAWDVEL